MFGFRLTRVEMSSVKSDYGAGKSPGYDDEVGRLSPCTLFKSWSW